jgi:hypothetical protein
MEADGGGGSCACAVDGGANDAATSNDASALGDASDAAATTHTCGVIACDLSCACVDTALSACLCP